MFAHHSLPLAETRELLRRAEEKAKRGRSGVSGDGNRSGDDRGDDIDEGDGVREVKILRWRRSEAITIMLQS